MDYPPSPPHFDFAQLLAFLVTRRRRFLKLTVTEAARLAGLEDTEWYVLEMGWIPEDAELPPIAAALEMSLDDVQCVAEAARHYRTPMRSRKTAG